jgi:hypothetical protein
MKGDTRGLTLGPGPELDEIRSPVVRGDESAECLLGRFLNLVMPVRHEPLPPMDAPSLGNLVQSQQRQEIPRPASADDYKPCSLSLGEIL